MPKMEILVREMKISVSEIDISVPETAATLTLSSYTRKRVDSGGYFWPIKAVFSDN